MVNTASATAAVPPTTWISSCSRLVPAPTRSKLDQTPSEWLPPWKRYRCRYLVRYLRVAVAYELPVSRADLDAVRDVLPTC